MVYRILFSLSFTFALSFSGLGQASNKLIKKGDQYFLAKNFNKALEYYEQALLDQPDNTLLLQHTGESYTQIGQSGKGLEFLNKALELSKPVTAELHFALADAYHKNYQFDKAIEYYKKWDPANGRSREGSKLVLECEYAKTLVQNKVKAEVVPMPGVINSSFPDYLPKITADGKTMFFTSRRSGSTGGKLAADGLYYEDIYWSTEKGGWSSLQQANVPINSDDHDALIGLSGNGQTMFIYRGTNGGDIYIAEYNGKKWSVPSPLPDYINTSYFESSASLSPDGKTLYYVHGRPGNRDIYYCKKTHTGAWAKPKALEILNTSYDEESPFIHPDGKTLYFSSKGHNSMGGYDIFKSKLQKDGSWSTPKNLGFPINTPEDDLYFVLSGDGRTGYYASSRKGGKGFQDIYMIKMPYSQKNLTLFKGIVKDENGNPICADITITDNATQSEYAKFQTDCNDGSYLASLPSGNNYGINIEAKGYLFHSENIYLDENSGYKEFNNFIKVKSIKKDEKIILKNIFFDTGEAEIRDESKPELQRLVELLLLNPTLSIEISGHTDNVGNAGSNLLLSQKRARAVVEYLKANRISASRLKAIGHGSKFPIADNNEEEGRKKNRRTEFKIISL